MHDAHNSIEINVAQKLFTIFTFGCKLDLILIKLEIFSLIAIAKFMPS